MESGFGESMVDVKYKNYDILEKTNFRYSYEIRKILVKFFQKFMKLYKNSYEIL